MQELTSLSQLKPVKLDEELRPSEEIRLLLEPCYLGLLKPIGTLESPCGAIPSGRYFYFPIFSDTRVYREVGSDFGVYREGYEAVKAFAEEVLTQIGNSPQREELQAIHMCLDKYMDSIKRFEDDLKWKEVSKERKLKS